MNQFYYTYPKGNHWVTLPNTPTIKLILTPDTPKSEKKNLGYRKLPLLWVCFPFLSKSNYLISYPYQSLCKTWRHVLWEVFFRFMSIPPVQEEHYKPALHLIFIPEYYGWWNTQPYIERDLCHSGRIRGRILSTQI